MSSPSVGVEYNIKMTAGLFTRWREISDRKVFNKFNIASSLFQNDMLISHEDFVQFKQDMHQFTIEAKTEFDELMKEIEELKKETYLVVLSNDSIPF